MLQLDLPKYKTIETICNSSQEYISFSQGTVKISGTPELIKEHIRERLQSDVLDYYQHVGGIFPLREKIAEKLCLKPEQVMISHGSIGAITAICLLLLKEGDEVLLFDPAYPSYRNIILFSKAKPIYITDIDHMKQATSNKTKMLIISNPVNPTGKCYSKDELLVLIDWCEKQGIYLVSDEVYDNYIYEGEFHSCTPLVSRSEYILRTGSFSKDYAMSGWRVGYVVAPQALIPRLIAVQDGTLCCPSVVGQYAALFALQHEYLVAEQVKTVKRNRDLVHEYLQDIITEKPQAGIFYFIKTQFDDSEPLVMDILQKAKVALVPGKDFGPTSASQFRLCFARKESVLIEGLQRLKEYLQKFNGI